MNRISKHYLKTCWFHIDSIDEYYETFCSNFKAYLCVEQLFYPRLALAEFGS